MSFLIYTQNADLYRLNQETSNSDRERWVKIYAGLKVNIQPASLGYAMTQPDGAIGKIYKAFTTYSGCQIGMVLVSSGTITTSGMRYEITGIEDYLGPLGKHFELVLRKSTS